MRAEDGGIEADGNDRRADEDVVAGAGHETERPRHVRDDEGELADLREAAGDGEGGLQRMSADDDDGERGERFDEKDDAEHAEEQPRRVEERAVIEEHADGDEEEDRERVAHRQHIGRGLVADFRLPDDHAAEECAERHRGAEGDIGNRRHADRHDEHGEGEEFARTQSRDAQEQPRDEARAGEAARWR